MDNGAVVVSAFKDGTEEDKIGNHSGECQVEGDATTDGRDTNEEETGTEDIDKESFSEKGVKRKSLLDPANEVEDLRSDEKGDENRDKEEKEPTNNTDPRIRGECFEAGSTSSDRSKPEQVVRFEGVELIGDGAPLESTTETETMSVLGLKLIVEESTAKLKGLWLQSRQDLFIISAVRMIIIVIITITIEINMNYIIILTI